MAFGAIFQAPPHFQIAFDSYWRSNLAQQTNESLAGTYWTQDVDGESFRGDIIGNQNYAMSQITSRAGKAEPSDLPTAFWWVRPRGFDKTTWIDQFDHIKLGKLGDPTSSVNMQHSIAAQRQKDLINMVALGGTRFIGPQGTTSQVLPTTGGPAGTGQTIAVTYGSGGANSGLQLAKLTQASYILDGNNVAFDGRYFGYAPKELNNLITNVDEVNSVLYNDVRALRAGRVRDFMGFEFKMSTLWPFSSGSTTIRNCYAWQRNFLCMGVGQDVRATIDRLPQQKNATQVYTCLLMDSTRVQDEGVVQVACDESV